jgi:hypothetical protein
MNTEPTMKLWTFHPSAFSLYGAGRIDHTLGGYWNYHSVVVEAGVKRVFGYRVVLPILHELLGTDQLLWCDTDKSGRYHGKEMDEIGWELNVPLSQVAAFYWVMAWEDLVWGRTDSWDDLFVDKSSVQPCHDFGALVRFPLERQWVKCLGKPCHNKRVSRSYSLWEKKKRSSAKPLPL